jgi:D-alanyl-D-alanine dipeptidase
MKNNVHAQDLSRYMMSAGLTDLASEWWHYQDSACHSKIGSGANFWSAV